MGAASDGRFHLEEQGMIVNQGYFNTRKRGSSPLFAGVRRVMAAGNARVVQTRWYPATPRLAGGRC
jgi:hypothetical protein